MNIKKILSLILTYSIIFPHSSYGRDFHISIPSEPSGNLLNHSLSDESPEIIYGIRQENMDRAETFIQEIIQSGKKISVSAKKGKKKYRNVIKDVIDTLSEISKDDTSVIPLIDALKNDIVFQLVEPDVEQCWMLASWLLSDYTDADFSSAANALITKYEFGDISPIEFLSSFGDDFASEVSFLKDVAERGIPALYIGKMNKFQYGYIDYHERCIYLPRLFLDKRLEENDPESIMALIIHGVAEYVYRYPTESEMLAVHEDAFRLERLIVGPSKKMPASGTRLDDVIWYTNAVFLKEKLSIEDDLAVRNSQYIVKMNHAVKAGLLPGTVRNKIVRWLSIDYSPIFYKKLATMIKEGNWFELIRHFVTSGVIAYDLDGTLALRNKAITPDMASLLAQLLKAGFKVALITGRTADKVKQRVISVLDNLNILEPHDWTHLVLYTTNGSQKFSCKKEGVRVRLREDTEYHRTHGFESDAQKQRIESEIRKIIKKILNKKFQNDDLPEALRTPDIRKLLLLKGLTVNDEQTQLTFKYPDMKDHPDSLLIRRELSRFIHQHLPEELRKELRVCESGMTSINILRHSVSKASAFADLIFVERFLPEEIIYIGDEFMEPDYLRMSGNDAFATMQLGVTVISVEPQRGLTKYIFTLSDKRGTEATEAITRWLVNNAEEQLQRFEKKPPQSIFFSSFFPAKPVAEPSQVIVRFKDYLKKERDTYYKDKLHTALNAGWISHETAARVLERITDPVYDDVDRTTLGLLVDYEEWDKINNNFHTVIPFKNAGFIRAKINPIGTNCMNKYTVRRITQGLAQHITDQDGGVYRGPLASAGVVVGFDTRYSSAYFAEEAARVLTANGIRVYLFDKPYPTSAVGFATAQLKAASGISITAGPHPWDYSGIKIYEEDGGIMSDEVLKQVSLYYHGITQNQIKYADLHSKEYKELVSVIPINPLRKNTAPLYYTIANLYIQSILRSCPFLKEYLDSIQGKGFTVAFDPLYGTATLPIKKVSKIIGLNTVVVKKHLKLPEHIGDIKDSNPANPQNLTDLITIAKKNKANIAIAFDADSGRLSVSVPVGSQWKTLSWNDMWALVLNYKAKNWDIENSLRQTKNGISEKVILKSWTTTDMLKRIAEDYNIPCFNLPDGSRWASEYSRFHHGQEVIAFSEYGLILPSHSMEKDAVAAAFLIIEMALSASIKGSSLWENLQDLKERYGESGMSIARVDIPGKTLNDTQVNMNAILQYMRRMLPEQSEIRFNGIKVLGKKGNVGKKRRVNGQKEYFASKGSDGWKFFLKDGMTVLVRPHDYNTALTIYIEYPQGNKHNLAPAAIKRNTEEMASWMKNFVLAISEGLSRPMMIPQSQIKTSFSL